MAEYVQRRKVINRLPNKQTIELIRDIEPADVVEREKIEKAIKEIKEVSFKHYFEQGEYIGEITERWEVVKLDHVIKILKENIGE